MPYKHVSAQGYRFLFATDPADPEMLHIYARHLTTVEDALRTWFDEASVDVWNEERNRWETHNAGHMLYWNWLEGEENETVVVISCYEIEE